MLDHTKNERACVDNIEFEWLGMTINERRLIGIYRSLNEQEKFQLRRLSQILATNPDELSAGNSTSR